tara:strand:- start:739 stop:1095 length:357 start_codon:yes stop_codon:yes gene_type:complete
MIKTIKIFLILFLFQSNAVAEDPRAIELFKEIRCLVCQGQTIHESNAELAEDIKKLIREKISQGETDLQIKKYLVERYGDWILMTPPFNSLTYILWSFPFLIMIIGAIAIYRQKKAQA